MSDYAGFVYGGTTYPLTSATTNTLLQDADPAIYWALQFYAQCLKTHIEPRLLVEATAIGAGVSAVVGTSVAYELGPYATSTWKDLLFPLLGVRRKASTQTQLTASFTHVSTECEIFYILPHMAQIQAATLIPIFHAIEQVLVERTDNGSDPTFLSEARVWGPGYANLESIDLVGPSEYGFYQANEQLVYQSWKSKLVIVERLMKGTSPLVKFAGGDITANLVAPDGTTVPALLQASTQQAPTVTSLSIATGSIAGGTSTTITGTLFTAGAIVRFGGLLASSVVYVNPTTITCVSPAVSGPGTLQVSVTNIDRQTGSLPAAFAFV